MIGGAADYVAAAAVAGLGIFMLVHDRDSAEEEQAGRLRSARGLAVIALGVWSAVLAAAGKFAELIGGVIFVGWIFYGLGAASIFPIRRASPGRILPYRVPRYPRTPLIFVLAAGARVANAIYLA